MAYTKTNWQDLPNTTTPINATNLNKIENQLEVLSRKSYIYAQPTSNTSIPEQTYTNITNWSGTQTIGSQLSITNGVLKIGSGVNHIRITITLGLNCSDDTLYSYLVKNGSNYGFWLVKSVKGVYDATTRDEIIPVSENDTITCSVYLSYGGAVANNRTNMVVEVID